MEQSIRWQFPGRRPICVLNPIRVHLRTEIENEYESHWHFGRNELGHTYEWDTGSKQQDPDQEVFELLHHQLPQRLAWNTSHTFMQHTQCEVSSVKSLKCVRIFNDGKDLYDLLGLAF